MKDACYLGGYWGNRSETADQCGSRAAVLLRVLATCDDSFAHWYTKGRSIQDAMRQEVGADDELLAQLFRRGVNRRDLDGVGIPELGFRLGLWNGMRDGGSDLSIKCGGSASTPQTWLPNSCVLSLPTDGEAAARIHTAPVLQKVLVGVVDAFDPDWAVVTSHGYRDKLGSEQPEDVGIGWITYFSRRQGELPLLPAAATKVPAGEGTVVVLGDAPLDVSNVEHLRLAREYHRTLRDAGILQRRIKLEHPS